MSYNMNPRPAKPANTANPIAPNSTSTITPIKFPPPSKTSTIETYTFSFSPYIQHLRADIPDPE